MQLFSASDYMTEARTLLQDLVGPPYRYTDDTILMGLNGAMNEIARLRPDLFADMKYQTRMNPNAVITDNIPPTYTTANVGSVVPIPPQYKQAVVFYIAGLSQLLDTEDTTDVRATGFMTLFKASMTSLQ